MVATGRVIGGPHVLNPHAKDFNPNKGQMWEGSSLASSKHLMPLALLVPALLARAQVPVTDEHYASMGAADSYVVGEAVVAHGLQCHMSLNKKKGRVRGQTGDMVFVDFEDDRRALNVRNLCRAPPEEEDMDGSDEEVEVWGPFPMGQGPPQEFFLPEQPLQPLPFFNTEHIESKVFGEEEDAPPPLIEDDESEAGESTSDEGGSSSDSDLCILRAARHGHVPSSSWTRLEGSPSDLSSQGMSPEVSPRGSFSSGLVAKSYVASPKDSGNVVQGKVIRHG
jgi:hypothetical protein